MPRAFLACSLLGLALLTAGCGGKSKSNETSSRGGPDAAALQGTWEQQPEEGRAAAPKQRVIKQVNGDTETVTTYGPDGKVVHAQTARFKLSHRGDVPVYTFYDRRITAGPEQGRDEGAARSYVYRLRGDEFDEVWGLLPGQEQRELVVRRWRRAGQAR
jgi:hypothetical protein